MENKLIKKNNTRPESYFLEIEDRNESVLSENDQLAVVEIAEDYFHHTMASYEYADNIDEYLANSNDGSQNIIEQLEKLFKNDEQKIRKAVLLFFEQIYIEITDDASEKDENIILIFHKKLFSKSFLVEKLSPQDRIKVYSRFSRSLDLNKISDDIFLNIVEDFKKGVDLSNFLSHCGIANQIDIVLMVERVAEFSNRKSDEQSRFFCLKFLSDFIDKSEFPIARVLASQIYNKIENRNFGGPVKRHNNEPQIISSDYIGKTDQDGLLEKVALYSGDIQLDDFRPIDEIFEDFHGKVFSEPMTRRDLLFLFKQLHRPEIKKIFENDFGILYSELDLVGQINVLKYLAEKNSNILDRIHKIIKKDFRLKKEVLPTLLACVVDDNFDNTLLDFLEEESVEDVLSILGSFNNLISRIKNIDQDIKKNITKHRHVDRTIAIQQFILRATTILKKAMINPQKSNELFDQADAEVLLFSSIFQTALKSSAISEITDVASFDINKVSNQDLSTIEKNEMFGVVAQNWLSRGAIGAEVLSNFKKTIDEAGSFKKWSILKKDKRIISFVGFENLDSKDGRPHVYAGSFNVDAKFRGSSIGEIMIREVLIQESKRAVLHATMDPRIDVGTRYVEDIGFLVTGVAENYLDTAESFFEITADQAVLGNFESRGWTREQALMFARERARESLAAQAERGDIIVASVTRDAGAEPEFISGAAEILRAGFVGTRYLSEGEGSKVRYMIFEKSK